MASKQDTNTNTDKWKTVILIFLFSLAVRLWNFNAMGRTWDEASYVEVAYKYVQLVGQNNFSDRFWYIQSDHPPLARYMYAALSSFDIQKKDPNGIPTYYYNYTFARLASTLLSCFAIVLIFLLGNRFFSRFIGTSAGIIFALNPFFLGFSHIATLEALIMATYTASLYFFLLYLDSKSQRYKILTGVFLGLALLTKITNLWIIVTITLIYFLQFISKPTKQTVVQSGKELAAIISIAIVVTIILWPMAWLHLDDIWAVQQTMRFSSHLSIPERFFGKLVLVPVFYYPMMFLITTPLLLLILGCIGALRIDKKRTLISLGIVVWFVIPFFQTFYHMRQHGIRYIIEVIAPFSLLAAIGLGYITNFFSKKFLAKVLSIVIVSMYLFIQLQAVTPYYIDYFNEVVGGNRNVYDKQLFQMGWWGEGIGEATYYIHNKEKRNVTVAIEGAQPEGVMPKLKNITAVYYQKDTQADYIIVPYFNIVRLGFVEQEILQKYHVVHSVYVGGAPFVKIYKRNA